MTIKVINDQQALQEGLEILIAHLEPAKVARFVAACKLGEGDYLKLKDKLFAFIVQRNDGINDLRFFEILQRQTFLYFLRIAAQNGQL